MPRSHLTPADDVHIGGQHVHHFSFALVAPLGAQDDVHLGLVHLGAALVQLLVVRAVGG